MSGEQENRNVPVCQEKGELASFAGALPPSGDTISDLICRELIAEAKKMLPRAYAPYSGFRVGAALLTASKRIYTGCNVENAAFSPAVCAERTAFFKAVSEGEQEFTAIAVIGGKKGIPSDYTAPCGVCRQVMTEFCDPQKFYVIIA
ncbi:MAG: cytidine deaminase, partial [Lachnospiraceae bacterium]|nr:cytidine deaminase [Lachnospiraceae bacterium]